MQVLVLYYSKGGNTRVLAESIAQGIDSVEGVTSLVRATDQVTKEDFIAAGGVIAGSPVYFGGMAAELKQVFDAFVGTRRKMEGKVGAAFATSGDMSGGKETTMMSILQCMLITAWSLWETHCPPPATTAPPAWVRLTQQQRITAAAWASVWRNWSKNSAEGKGKKNSGRKHPRRLPAHAKHRGRGAFPGTGRDLGADRRCEHDEHGTFYLTNGLPYFICPVLSDFFIRQPRQGSK